MNAPYTRAFSFSGFQSNRPNQPLPGQRVDIELDNIARALASVGLGTGGGSGTPGGGPLKPIPPGTLLANLSASTAIPTAVSVGTLKGSLGLGTAASLNVGVPGGVAAFDDPRFGANADVSGFLTKSGNLAGLADLPASRQNLGLGSAAVLNAGVSGGVALHDDPRFGQGGGAGIGISVVPYLTAAMLAGTADAGPAFNQAANDCRSQGIRVLYVPAMPNVLLINTTVEFNQIHVMGPGAQADTAVNITTTADVTTFKQTGSGGNLSGIRINHSGNGRCVEMSGSLNMIVQGCFFGGSGSGTAPLVSFGGSNVWIVDNRFTNLRPNAHSVQCVRASDDICINNTVRGNYFGGPGKGILMAAEGNYTNPTNGVPAGQPRHRPEGLEIIGNHSILTGGAFVEIASCLSCRILSNMMDQSPTVGCVVFTPQGNGALGVQGVQIIGNYISPAQDVNNGVGINHARTSGYVAGVVIEGNHICFCGTGIIFAQGAQEISIDNNLFQSIAQGYCVRLTLGSLVPQVAFGSSNLCLPASPLLVDGGTPGKFRSKASKTSATNDGNWSANGFSGKSRYAQIPHGLGSAPDPETITLNCRITSEFADDVTARVVGFDNTNVQIRIITKNLTRDGTVIVNMTCAVSEAAM